METDITTVPVEELRKIVESPESHEDNQQEDSIEEKVAVEATTESAGEHGAEAQKEEQHEEQDYNSIIESLKSRIEKQEKLLAKTGTELGLLRKKSPEEERERLQRLRDLSVDDPIAFQEEYEKYKLERRQEEQRRLDELVQQNRSIVDSSIPNLMSNVNAIGELLKDDGYDDKSIEMFKSDPYKTPADMLFMLNKRVDQVAKHKKLESLVTELQSKIKELEAKPDALLKQIENASKQQITAKTGGAAPQQHSYNGEKPSHLLSVDELRRFLQ